jgi:hypothetical protein
MSSVKLTGASNIKFDNITHTHFWDADFAFYNGEYQINIIVEQPATSKRHVYLPSLIVVTEHPPPRPSEVPSNYIHFSFISF